MSTSVRYPVSVEGRLDTGLSRWLWLVKWLLAIPHYLVLVFLWVGFAVTSVVTFFAILFTGRYPRVLFDYNVGVLRWTWRVAYYAYGALGTDRYPPFTLADAPDYPARLAVTYPQHLSRGLVLVKWWLLAIPHYLVIGLFLGGATWAVGRYDDQGVSWAAGGLIELLVLVAAVVLLFTGRYPAPIFDFVLGMNRWVLRVAAYAGLMTDQYPPFRLDMGGTEPQMLAFTGDRTPPPAGPGPADVSPPPRTSPAGTSPAPGSQPPGLTAGRVVAIVVGALLALISLGPLVGGGAALVLDQTQRDSSGFVHSDPIQLSTATAALSSGEAQIQVDGPGAIVAHRLLGDAQVRVTAADGGTVFVGIAARADAEPYLAEFASTEVTGMGGGADVTYRTQGDGAPGTPPAEAGIWAVSAAGDGTQVLRWEPSAGDWVLVVMNADGSTGVDVTADIGAELPMLTWAAIGLLLVGGALLVGAALTIGFAVRRS